MLNDIKYICGYQISKKDCCNNLLEFVYVKRTLSIKAKHEILYTTHTTPQGAIVAVSKALHESLCLVENWVAFHGAIASIYGSNLLFLGKSNTGKSTTMAYFEHNSIARVFTDDLVFIRSDAPVFCATDRPILLRKGGYNYLRENYQMYENELPYASLLNRYIHHISPGKHEENELHAIINMDRISDCSFCEPISSQICCQHIFESAYNIANLKKSFHVSMLLSEKLPAFTISFRSPSELLFLLSKEVLGKGN